MRSLEHLKESAGSSRALNLLAVWTRHGHTEAYKSRPFFDSPVLNRAIIVKHRLRPEELDVFSDGRTCATKIILPIDRCDLTAGARSFFVGQHGYEGCLLEVAPESGQGDLRDERLLRVLEALPSLDPFLLRERLRKDNVHPARCYFDLSEADAARMLSFVNDEVEPLIGVAFNASDSKLAEKIARLSRKLMENAADDALEPLRASLAMNPEEFQEGVFCWKGFLYYKWTLSGLAPQAQPTALEIARVWPTGAITSDEKEYVLQARARLAAAIVHACRAASATVQLYSDAYRGLTQRGRPQEFRSFLLKAPAYFQDLGEALSAVQDIVSFWRFRFPSRRQTKVYAPELVGLLSDFEAAFIKRDPEGGAVGAPGPRGRGRSGPGAPALVLGPGSERSAPGEKLRAPAERSAG